MTTEERILQSEARVFKAIFPSNVNHYDTLFGGAALAYMDEVAFIAATRYSRQKMVTVSSDRIDFKRPIPSGTLIEVVAKVIEVGNTSIKVGVEIFVEQMHCEGREKAIEGVFSFVAIGENKKPERIR